MAAPPIDRLEVRVDARDYVSWPGGGGFQPVQLRVNGEDLIELVRRAELPFACAEWDERTARGDELGERGSLAGQYLHLDGGSVFLPSRNLLGEPYGGGSATDDPRNRLSLLLQCTCGITECWFLLADIRVEEKTVTWSDFRQFHRDWKYQLGPFVFDRREYEAQLAR